MVFFSPSSPACFTCFRALLQAQWFFKTGCSLFSCRADLISCTATLRDRQLHLQELAQPFMPAAHGGTESLPAQQLSLWDFCTGLQLPSRPWAPRAGGNADVTPGSGTGPGASWPRACDQPRQAWQRKHRLSMCFYMPRWCWGRLSQAAE